MTKIISEKLIFALDVGSKDEFIKYIKLLKNKLKVIKIGGYLFTKEGPDIVRIAKDEGFKVFLDLKFHDIPNTVAKTAEVATALGVDMFTLHTTGGKEMMRACAKAVSETAEKYSITPPVTLGVTILSSIDEHVLLRELKVGKKIKSYVKILARSAYDSGLSGVVASGEEMKNIKKVTSKDFKIVVPGIRPAWFGDKDDQKRILTPEKAIKMGADFLVIGRPILKSSDPVRAVEMIHKEILSVNA